MRSRFRMFIGGTAVLAIVTGVAIGVPIVAPAAAACSAANARGCDNVSPEVVTLTVGPGFVPDNKGGAVKLGTSTSRPGDTTTGLNTVINVDTTGLRSTDFVQGLGIPPNTYVTSVDSPTQVTLSTAATATTTGVALTFDDLLNGGAIVNCHTAPTAYVPADPNAVVTGAPVAGKPVRINIHFQPNYLLLISNGTAISTGCNGDSDPNTIEFNIHQDGDGRTYGVQWDALKFQGGTNVEITGTFNCGLPGAGAHQDSAQYIASTGIHLIDPIFGDWYNNRSTCRGDGGSPYINCNKAVAPATGCTAQFPSGVDVERARSITCNKGLNSGTGSDLRVTGNVSKSVFRTGSPIDYQPGGPCDPAITNSNPPGSPITTSAADDGTGHMVGSPNITVSGNIGETWCATGCAWSPGFNPAYNNGAP